jgi:hypothetical protein
MIVSGGKAFASYLIETFVVPDWKWMTVPTLLIVLYEFTSGKTTVGAESETAYAGKEAAI